MIIPNDSQRHVLVGRTGSGKTTLAVHTLAYRSWTDKPWIVLNFKDDELLNKIPGTIELPPDLSLPEELNPGIYMGRPMVDDYDNLERLFNDIWLRRDTGLFVDEGLPISQPKHPAFRKILTQGRSRRVPVIIGTQRPVDLDRYVFSESEYMSVMRLSDLRETEKFMEITGLDLDMKALPKYHSYFIDRLDDENPVSIVLPAPSEDEILGVFAERMENSRRMEPRPPAYFFL